MNDIKITFQVAQSEPTHNYILRSSNAHAQYVGDIRYIARQRDTFRHRFGLTEQQTQELVSQIIKEYLEWNRSSDRYRKKVRY